jgi:hypothetical protein
MYTVQRGGDSICKWKGSEGREQEGSYTYRSKRVKKERKQRVDTEGERKKEVG